MRSALCLAVVITSIIGLATLGPALAGTRLETGAPVVPPAGFLGFCVKHLPDCTGRTNEPAPVELTPDRLRSLQTVQAAVNAAISPRVDPTHTWDYPTGGTGDCNRYALEKRRRLIAQGWPREALLLATATTETGEGHLVVVARTDHGDLVLDNRVASVVEWPALPYHWVSIQSPKSPVQWLSILAPSVVTADGSALRPILSATP